MRRVKKAGFVLLLCLMALGMLPGAAQAAKTTAAKTYSLKDVRKAETVSGKWVSKDKKVRFLRSNGKYVKSRWIRFGGQIYYLGSKGYRVSDWVKYRGKMYFMRKDGAMHTGWIGKTWFMHLNGTRASGLTTIGGEKYYFDKKSGKKKTGWVNVGKNRYYFDKKTGIMKKMVWVHTGKSYYYVGTDGKLLKSRWLILGSGRYYLDHTGARVTGVYFVGNKGYYFKKNGVCDLTVKVDSEVNPNKPMVALTFDDGPGPYTARLLDCLQKNHAKATFFMVGNAVMSYKNTVKRMASLGCELGGHSYSHAAFTKLSSASRAYQVNTTVKKIKEASGRAPTVFRLPYGDGYNNRAVLNSLGLPSIYWSIDTMDWANTGNPQHTVNEVLGHVRSGDIVLMHDIHRASVQAAETIIPALKRRGFQLVTVSQLARYKGKVTLQKGKTYFSFK